MSNLPDPEDIDLFVGGVEPDPTASVEAERIIGEHTLFPDHPRKVEEAKRLLATLGVNTPNCDVPDPNSLNSSMGAGASPSLRKSAIPGGPT